MQATKASLRRTEDERIDLRIKVQATENIQQKDSRGDDRVQVKSPPVHLHALENALDVIRKQRTFIEADHTRRPKTTGQS